MTVRPEPLLCEALSDDCQVRTTAVRDSVRLSGQLLLCETLSGQLLLYETLSGQLLLYETLSDDGQVKTPDSCARHCLMTVRSDTLGHFALL